MKAGETNDDCSFHNLNLENEDISKILKHFRFAFYIFLFTLKNCPTVPATKWRTLESQKRHLGSNLKN